MAGVEWERNKLLVLFFTDAFGTDKVVLSFLKLRTGTGLISGKQFSKALLCPKISNLVIL